MRLHLSQDLIIHNRFTISVPGEAEHYFGSCTLIGETEHINSLEGVWWFALTEKAQKVWKGDTKIGENGNLLGCLKYTVVNMKGL